MMDRRPQRIGIDLDGPLAHFNKGFRELVHRHTSVRLPPLGPDYPDVWLYHRAAGVTMVQDAVLWAIIADPAQKFWQKLDPTPCAIECLGLLASMMATNDVVPYFITSRPGDSAHQQSREWLTQFGFSNYATVLIAPDEECKGKLAAGLALDAFIDDKIDNCRAVRYHSPTTRVFLHDQPYNRGVAVDGVTRVSRVRTVREMLEQLGLLDPRIEPTLVAALTEMDTEDVE